MNSSVSSNELTPPAAPRPVTHKAPTAFASRALSSRDHPFQIPAIKPAANASPAPRETETGHRILQAALRRIPTRARRLQENSSGPGSSSVSRRMRRSHGAPRVDGIDTSIRHVENSGDLRHIIQRVRRWARRILPLGRIDVSAET